MARHGELPELCLSVDYGATFPLWPLGTETEALVPEPLHSRMVAWQRSFDMHFHWERGWDTEDAKRSWGLEGAQIARELRDALEGVAELTVDLWPLSRQVEAPSAEK